MEVLSSVSWLRNGNAQYPQNRYTVYSQNIEDGIKIELTYVNAQKDLKTKENQLCVS